MAYSPESVRKFWALMRATEPRSFLVRRLLQRLERGELDEQEAAEWLACDERQLAARSRVPGPWANAFNRK
jgi:hypothetical protein